MSDLIPDSWRQDDSAAANPTGVIARVLIQKYTMVEVLFLPSGKQILIFLPKFYGLPEEHY